MDKCENKVNETKVFEEGNEVITDDGKLSQAFNEYFVNICSKPGYHFFLRE